ncbi:hypothetical protein LJB96_05470, partial [Methanobrevibacter sp. OttesenSCG-928-K11]|nr:hypothetical protein [Methanobrevibacter sp. OttesenSCG-928-K11]
MTDSWDMMDSRPILVIKTIDGNKIGVRARIEEDFIEHEIVLNSVLLITVNNHLMPSDFLSGSKKIASTLKLPQEIIDMNFYKNDE